MDSATFVSAIKTAVHDSSVHGVIETLERVPGRKPALRLVELSEWFRSLSTADKQRVAHVVELAVHAGIFGFLCAIDGVRTIEGGGAKGELELAYLRDGKRSVLNDPAGEFLHDIYQGLVYEQVHGQRDA